MKLSLTLSLRDYLIVCDTDDGRGTVWSSTGLGSLLTYFLRGWVGGWVGGRAGTGRRKNETGWERVGRIKSNTMTMATISKRQRQ